MVDEAVIKNGTRVIASKTGDFSDSVIGIIDAHSPHRGPSDAPDNSFYIVLHWQSGESIPAILMTPFVRRDALKEVQSIEGVIQVDEYPNGIIVEASNSEDFSEVIVVELYGQLFNGDLPLFIVKYYSHSLGMNTTEAFRFIRFPDVSVVPTPVEVPEESDLPPVEVPDQPPIVRPEMPPVETPAITKPQLFGLITQLENLIQNGHDTAAAMRSVANLYSKPDEVLKELDALRGLIQHHG